MNFSKGTCKQHKVAIFSVETDTYKHFETCNANSEPCRWNLSLCPLIFTFLWIWFRQRMIRRPHCYRIKPWDDDVIGTLMARLSSSVFLSIFTYVIYRRFVLFSFIVCVETRYRGWSL